MARPCGRFDPAGEVAGTSQCLRQTNLGACGLVAQPQRRERLDRLAV